MHSYCTRISMLFTVPCLSLPCRHYTVRYRERNRKWIYQTCPTSDTVIDNLKPNTPYEFGVRSNKDERSGIWSKPVIHKTNMGAGLGRLLSTCNLSQLQVTCPKL